VQEKARTLQELYDNGREAWTKTATTGGGKFKETGRYERAPQTDAALYWKAYARDNRLGKRDAALTTICGHEAADFRRAGWGQT